MEIHFGLDTDALHSDPQWGGSGIMVNELFGELRAHQVSSATGIVLLGVYHLGNHPQLET